MAVIRPALTAAAALALAAPVTAIAAPVTDCGLRDAPFSVDSPLIDVLLNPAARAALDKAIPGALAKMPPGFAGTTPPTFAAILSPRTLLAMGKTSPAAVAALDADLRALPVTDADRVARCARYDADVPAFDLPAKSKGKALLLFEKINGFKDVPSVNAAHEALIAMAARKGWTIVSTDKAGAFTPASLKRFGAVIWNNISGDVLTLSQRKALQDYMAGGGGFVGIHGSAGDPTYFWDWYPDTLIGARFKGHPMAPQFQDARVVVDKKHPLAKALPAQWTMKDEWYSFSTNPRTTGARVLLTLDESTYKPDGMAGQDLRMGDHPIAWTRCIGKGRVFYSAIGHMPETYAQPQNVAMLEAAIGWAASKRTCRP